ncbi:MAG: AAA family ATPase [Bdellovibrionota bacterium]
MTTEKRPIPIGLDDFKQIRENNYFYIDKTFLIKEILSSGSSVTLFTRPRRFGKTMNMSMLQYFLDCNIPSSKALFEGLKIAQEHAGFCSQHMNKCPVIFVSFKDILYENKVDFYLKLNNYISNIYNKFRYLLDSKTTSPEQREWFSTLLAGKADASLLEVSLMRLTMLLEQHHGVKPFLLIDEYDVPIHSAFHNGQYEDCIKFMKVLYGSALKGNTHLNKGVMTGILRVAKESIFSGLNHLDVASVVSYNYPNFFGITEQELKNLLVDYRVESQCESVKNWYNGYQFGQNTTIYNPWSILNWLHNGHQFNPYWLNTSSNDLVRSLFFAHKEKLQEIIFKLLSGENVKIRLSEDLHFPSLQTNCSNEDYLTLLLHSGYLTTRNEEFLQNRYWYTLSIPNEEIRIIFSDMMDMWLKQIAPNLQENMSLIILNSLRNNDLKTFETHFSNVVLQVMSYHDFAEQPENAFHCFTAGFLSWLSHEYEVRSNRETGEGRADILLLPKNNSLPGYVFELKAYRPKKEPKKLPLAGIKNKLNLALKQIEEKNYEAEFKSRNIAKVTKIAMVFYKKKVWFKTNS